MSNIIPITFLSDDHAFWTYARVQETLGKGKPTFSFSKAYDENTFSDVVRIGSYGAYAWPDYVGLIKGGMADKIIQALDDGYSLEMISYETTDTPEGNTIVNMVILANIKDTNGGVMTEPEHLGSKDHTKAASEPDNVPEDYDLARKWKNLLDTLLDEHPQHGSLLLGANPVSDDGETLVLQLHEGSAFALRMLQRPDVGLSVARAVTQVFGPRQVECTCDGDRAIIPQRDTLDDIKKDDAAQTQTTVPAKFSTPAQPPIRTLDSASVPITEFETARDVCKLTEKKWEDAIKTMRGLWPITFRFTRMVSDDGTTVAIWVPKWSELDACFDEESSSFDRARKVAEEAIEKTFYKRHVVFWRAGESRPSGCNAPEPEPDDDFVNLSEQEIRLERAIRPYLIRDFSSELKA